MKQKPNRMDPTGRLFRMTLAVFLFGVGRAYARVRGEQPDWQREGAFLLFKWSTAGSFGALGGMLGGVIASAFVIVPYWYEWRTDSVTDWIVNARCPQFHWAHYDMPTTCPKLGQLLAEGALSGIFILTTLGFLAIHFIEWMVRGWPAKFFNKGHAVHVFAGAMLGGTIAGFVVGPLITAYFGSYAERPFLEPNFAIPFAVAAVAITAFSISNYSLETFTAARLRRSAVGAVLGTAAAAILLGAMIGLLYISGFINAALLWAGNGFFDESLPTLQRYSYLLIVGLPYGMIFGLSFGVLIAVTRIMTDRHRQDDGDLSEPQTPHRSAL